MANQPLDIMPAETLEQLQAEMDAHLLKRPTSYSAPAFAEWALQKERIQGRIDLAKSRSGKWSKI